MMGQCTFIDFNKCTAVLWDAESQWGCACLEDWPTVLASPVSLWLNVCLLIRNAPKPNEFPINLYPCLYQIRKLEECLLLMQMANSHETSRGREDPWSQSLFMCVSLGGQVLFFRVGPFESPSTPFVVWNAVSNVSGSSVCKLPTIYFIGCTFWSCLLWFLVSKVPSQFGGCSVSPPLNCIYGQCLTC